MSQKGPLLTGAARDLVLEYLKVNLNPALKDPDLVNPYGVPLGQISQKNFFITPIKETLECPACYVLIGNMRFDYNTQPNYVEAEHDLQTVMTAEAMDADDLQHKVESYARALFNVLDQQDLATPDGRLKVKLISMAIEYGDFLLAKESSDRKKMRRDCIYRWKAIHVENRLIP